MGKYDSTQTTKEKRNYAPWIGKSQEYVGNTALGQNQNFLDVAPSYQLAGLNPDQTKAYDLARGAALDYGGGSSVPGMADLMSGSRANAMFADPSSSALEQLAPNSYRQFMNPYTQSVIDPMIDNLHNSADQQKAGIAARAAAAGSFGGSREALQEGQVDRGVNEQIAQIVPQLYSQAYDSAQGLASGNVDRAQSTGQFNAQLAQQAGLQNAQLGTNVNLQNAGNALQAYGLNSSLQDADLQRRLSAINALLGTGNAQQEFAQKGLDIPYTALQRFASFIPAVYDYSGSKTEPSQGGGGLGSILGGIGSILGALPLSDKREKTDIQKLGNDEASGLDMYAYRYKGDPKSYPKVVGPMAQDVQKKYPDAVTEVSGRLAISPLAMLLGS